MKTLKYMIEGLTLTFIIVFGIGLLILFSPILICLGIYSYYDNLSFEKEYCEYLQTINGTKFFCYNNRKTSQEFIESKIVPTLAPEIKVIFLDGKTPKSDYEQKFISKALNSIKDRKGFPYLLKIENGQLYDKSINNDFYNTMQQNREVRMLIENINTFFRTVWGMKTIIRNKK